jgi:hypothetical protein
LLRRELPDLTDADIKWLSDLSEEMEQFEPPTPITVMDTMDSDEQNLDGTAKGTKKRRSNRIANRDAVLGPGHNRRKLQMWLTLPEMPHHDLYASVSRTPHHCGTTVTESLICRSTRQYNTRPSVSDAALANSEDQAEHIMLHIHFATEAVNDQRVSRLDQVAGPGPRDRSSQEGLSRAAPVTAPIRCRLASIPLPLRDSPFQRRGTGWSWRQRSTTYSLALCHYPTGARGYVASR